MTARDFWRIPGLSHDDALREERIDRLGREIAQEPDRDARVALCRQMQAEVRARSPRAVEAIERARGLR